MIIGSIEKQAAEVTDVRFNFGDWLTDKGDTIASVSVVAEAGLTVLNVSNLNGVVLAFLSGGTVGSAYKVTCTITTASTPARVKEAEIYVGIVDR